MSTMGRSQAVVVDTSRSPFARLRPVPITAVTLTDAFWSPRRRANREIALPAQYRFCEGTGLMDNFRRAAGRKDMPFQGVSFTDPPVYKWLEAAAWTLATDDDPVLARLVDAVVEEIAAAQEQDGYLNTYFTFDRAGQRWSDLREMHELYSAGHLIQAAIAHRRVTGSLRLLHVATRLADHIGGVFGPASEGKRPATPGHPEIEMALVELARETGNQAYRKLAQFLLDARGHGLIGGTANYLDRVPFREMERMAGHAVRAVYLTAGVADLYAETGEPALCIALERLWHNMTTRQMYISGGIGSRYESEAFGRDYELPNERAYAETCAAVGSIMWAWRMLQLEGSARYADALETALYNSFLSGLSLDGTSYFYVDPLADDGTRRRQPWFETPCCPPNVARLLASLPSYFYGVSDDGVWVHLYAQGRAAIPLHDGRIVQIAQITRYPWDGQVDLEVNGDGDFSLFLRVPAWCEAGGSLDVNGRRWSASAPAGAYFEIGRTWRPGDMVHLGLPMPVRAVESHPYVTANSHCVALMRGPLLYCVEQADNPEYDLRDIVLVSNASFAAGFEPNLLGGVVALRGPAQLDPPSDRWAGRLYQTAIPRAAETQQPRQVTAVPYHAWANREPGPMRVWLSAT